MTCFAPHFPSTFVCEDIVRQLHSQLKMSPIALLKYLGSTVVFMAFALSYNPGVQGKSLSAELRRCEIGCLDIYKPICGTDGNTYPNECTLFVENNCDNTSPDRVRKAYDGECKSNGQYPDRPTCIKETLKDCISPQVLICGTDGKIYGDPCQLKAKNICDGTMVSGKPCAGGN